MAAQTGESRVRRPADAGPPLPLVVSISAVLLVAGLVVPFMLSGQPYPSPAARDVLVRSYVDAHPDAIRVASLFLFASSIPLAVFTAATVARLHALGVRAAGPTIALVGGLLASTALAVSACAQWALARMGDDADLALVRAVHDLAFISGGPWHVVALGLLLAGVAVSAAFSRLLPPAVWGAGVLLAVICELATLAFVSSAAAYLLPLGRFGGLIWLIVAGVVLPRARPLRNARGPLATPPAARAR